MRVARRAAADERGTVLLIVAVGMVILFGVSALAIDMGQNRAERRRLGTATDSAALAAAQIYGDGGSGCANAAPTYLSRNAPDAVMLNCTAFGDTNNGTFGWVVVEAEVVVPQFFAGTFGQSEVTVNHSSAAVFGGPEVDSPASGTRPMGLCAEGMYAEPEWVAWNADRTVESQPIRVLYNKNQPDDCGDTTGNWGFIDFNGGNNSNTDIKNWIEFGYAHPVQPGWYEGSPGAISGAHSSALQTLVDSGTQFWLPLVTEGGGNGSNVTFYVSEFLPVRLVGFKSNGKQANRYLEFVIVPVQANQSCCTTGTVGGDRIVGLFALDADGNPIGANP